MKRIRSLSSAVRTTVEGTARYQILTFCSPEDEFPPFEFLQSLPLILVGDTGKLNDFMSRLGEKMTSLHPVTVLKSHVVLHVLLNSVVSDGAHRVLSVTANLKSLLPTPSSQLPADSLGLNFLRRYHGYLLQRIGLFSVYQWHFNQTVADAYLDLAALRESGSGISARVRSHQQLIRRIIKLLRYIPNHSFKPSRTHQRSSTALFALSQLLVDRFVLLPLLNRLLTGQLHYIHYLPESYQSRLPSLLKYYDDLLRGLVKQSFLVSSFPKEYHTDMLDTTPAWLTRDAHEVYGVGELPKRLTITLAMITHDPASGSQRGPGARPGAQDDDIVELEGVEATLAAAFAESTSPQALLSPRAKASPNAYPVENGLLDQFAAQPVPSGSSPILEFLPGLRAVEGTSWEHKSRDSASVTPKVLLRANVPPRPPPRHDIDEPSGIPVSLPTPPINTRVRAVSSSAAHNRGSPQFTQQIPRGLPVSPSATGTDDLLGIGFGTPAARATDGLLGTGFGPPTAQVPVPAVQVPATTVQVSGVQMTVPPLSLGKGQPPGATTPPPVQGTTAGPGTGTLRSPRARARARSTKSPRAGKGRVIKTVI